MAVQNSHEKNGRHPPVRSFVSVQWINVKPRGDGRVIEELRVSTIPMCPEKPTARAPTEIDRIRLLAQVGLNRPKKNVATHDQESTAPRARTSKPNGKASNASATAKIHTGTRDRVAQARSRRAQSGSRTRTGNTRPRKPLPKVPRSSRRSEVNLATASIQTFEFNSQRTRSTTRMKIDLSPCFPAILTRYLTQSLLH